MDLLQENLSRVIHNTCQKSFNKAFQALSPFLEYAFSLECNPAKFNLYLTGSAAQYLIGVYSSFENIVEFTLLPRYSGGPREEINCINMRRVLELITELTSPSNNSSNNLCINSLLMEPCISCKESHLQHAYFTICLSCQLKIYDNITYIIIHVASDILINDCLMENIYIPLYHNDKIEPVIYLNYCLCGAFQYRPKHTFLDEEEDNFETLCIWNCGTISLSSYNFKSSPSIKERSSNRNF